MRLPQLFLAAALAITAILAAPATQAAPQKAGKTPYHRSVDPFVAELNRRCPGRHLEDLTAGDLGLIQEGFVGTLPLAQRRKVEDTVGRRCALVQAGLTCANNASLEAFRRLGLLRQFTAAACATSWSCQGFADCTQTRP